MSATMPVTQALVLAGLQALDLHSTACFLRCGGKEGNPIGVWLLRRWGLRGLAAAKLILTPLGLICLAHLWGTPSSFWLAGFWYGAYVPTVYLNYGYARHLRSKQQQGANDD